MSKRLHWLQNPQTQYFIWATVSILGVAISPMAIGRTKPAANNDGYSLQKQEQRDEKEINRIQVANSLYNSGDFSGAEQLYRKLIKDNPEDPLLRYRLGNTLDRQGKTEDAISAYQESIRLDPKYAMAHNAIGVVNANLGKWQEAIVEYQKALTINPTYADALKNQGIALLQTGKMPEALKFLEKADKIYRAQSKNTEAIEVEQLLQKIQRTPS
jgi:tetratricopeptide (TPR) repeat protein